MAANLTTINDPRSAVAEAYRRLRTNLEFVQLDRPLRTLLVTSAAPEADASTTIANLAVSMAQAGRRVIVVDCDLHQPRLHAVFGVDNGEGLTNVLRQADGSIPLQPSSVGGLSVLTAGPEPDIPADLIASPAMETLISTLQEQADIVLFAAPPVVSVADAAVLASKVDGVLLVVHSGRTRREVAQRAKGMLERVNACVVGAVLIDVPPDAMFSE